MSTYGIDLGTTDCCIATLDQEGILRIVRNEEDASDTLASVIQVQEDGTFLVGNKAKEEATIYPDTTFRFWKQYIGRDNIPDMPRYEAYGQTYDPVKLTAILLKKIVSYANDTGENVRDVVITCPAYFDFAQCEAIRYAGMCSDLNVHAVLNEPTAAALCYSYNSFRDQSAKVLVYDLGGGTFDVSIFEISRIGENPKVRFLACEGDPMLGGCNWDNCLHELLLQKYSDEYGIPENWIDEELRREFLSKAEDAKHRLSSREKTYVRVFYEGEKIFVKVTQDEFNAATRHLLDQTVTWVDVALSAAGLTDDDLDSVLMVGGATLMPQVHDMLDERFGDKVKFFDPHLVIAKGAALAASMLHIRQVAENKNGTGAEKG